MISIIIPALNEEKLIGICIESIRQHNELCEIIVADGGSSDRTIEIAESAHRITVIRTKKGRGAQMNAGAVSAQGDILLFLHADTTLEEGWSTAISGTLEDEAVIGGAFTFAINSQGAKYRVVELWVKLRCLLFKLPYGDQGIFLKKDFFNRLGGYKDVPLMEDVDLIERMKKFGTINILDLKALTSGRRWVEKGVLYTAVLNRMIMLLYKMGVNPHALARLYYR